ncbi:MAG: YhjD/YihY/BrkB family envelope integrity protein, partial [Desulfovibrionales bacterium]
MRYWRVFYRGTRNYLKEVWRNLDRLWTEFTNDNCFVLAGGIAYFTLFSLVPILLVIIGAFSFLLGQEAVKAEIYNLVKSYTGKESALQVMMLIERADLPSQGIKTTIL